MADVDATSLGEMLRQERLRKQLNLAAVAKETRISVAILDAIEKEHYHCVPGGAYRCHFIRHYACALGMDGDALVAAFRRQHEEPPVPIPVPPKTKPSRAWVDLVWAVVLGVAVVSSYEFVQTRDGGTKHFKKISLQAQRVRAPGRSLQTPQLPAASVDPAVPAFEPAKAGARGPVHVAFTASEPVWVVVKCDGRGSYVGVLNAPESKTFDAAGAVTALIGNAGGLMVSVNGTSLGPLGAHGEVQAVELTLTGARRISRQAAIGDGPAGVPQL